MSLRYKRNTIHIKEGEQRRIQDFRVLIGGCGIGSYIAECLLRMGFENMTIIDGDIVELTNLNRQNYVEGDIGVNKAIALKDRLMAIHPDAKIKAYPEFLDTNNLYSLDLNCDVAINALDFSSDIPFLFDEYMAQKNIVVVHPYNLGWAGFLTVITPESRNLRSLDKEHHAFEINVGKYIVDRLKEKNIDTNWLEDFLLEYGKIAMESPPPQLSLGLYLLAGMVCQVVFNIATDKAIRVFPESYYLSMRE
ncbi:ThiF family adenylyltransferase [Sphingobacterium sp. DR205]|uniref:HesA/MoeB/ThiF family protein n=1 Tax=Sphingobacterium sp. DR205 TaxID=2713573 RepID=UPI0013E4A0FC|nr:ThiF family adenylyltransferase [Sphingobacterium sp. DR205]QIH35139.1 ThiF family adenylyltransferase [Sphingobacterium sp. DR205]